jgi:hypothetical protein
MNRRKKAEVPSMIKIIGSIILLLIVLGVFVYKVWPWVRYGPFSPCWAGAVSNVRVLSGYDLLRDPQDVSLGDCIGGLYMVNRGDLEEKSREVSEDFGKIVECPEGGESYVFVFVNPELVSGGEWTWNIFKLPLEAVKEMKERIYSSVGVSTYCRILDTEMTFKYPVQFKGDSTCCVDIGKDDETNTYVVYHCRGTCDECGSNPFNLGLFEDEEDVKGTWYQSNGEVECGRGDFL